METNKHGPPKPVDWLGNEKKPPTRERPEGWAYQDFPEHPRDWMQEMLAETRQMQVNHARATRTVRWLCIILAIMGAVMLMDYLDHHG